MAIDSLRAQRRAIGERVKRGTPGWIRPALLRMGDVADSPRRLAWRRNGGLPVPPRSLRRRVGSVSLARYVQQGHDMASDIERIMSDRPLGSGTRVLDWGCGVGRAAMPLLERHPDLDLQGCDVDQQAIDWLRQNAPDGERRFRVSPFYPPLPYPDESFDVIYAISVFTHLDRDDQIVWLRELARILVPGGTAVLTTQGQYAFDRPVLVGVPEHTLEELNSKRGTSLEVLGFVFASYSTDLAKRDKFPGISGDYGMAFQSESWTRSNWSAILEIDQVVPAGVDGYQDAVIAVRRPA